GGVRSADMSGGEIVETGRALDVAVNGAALIAVQAPDGSEAYTRRGDLTLSATGLLVNGEGHPVVGDGGPITLPLNGSPSIAPDGTITVVDPAAPDQPPQELGRIKLAGWQGSPIAKGLDGLFRRRRRRAAARRGSDSEVRQPRAIQREHHRGAGRD